MDFRLAVAAIAIAATVFGLTLAESHVTNTQVLACGDTPGFCPNPPTVTTITHDSDGS
jgi:hypothetical protein